MDYNTIEGFLILAGDLMMPKKYVPLILPITKRVPVKETELVLELPLLDYYSPLGDSRRKKNSDEKKYGDVIINIDDSDLDYFIIE